MEHFNNSSDSNDQEYYNARLDQDERRFINPDLFKNYHGVNFDAKAATLQIKNFLADVFALYANGNVKAAAKLLAIPKEVNATRIGYGINPSKGRGTSWKILNDVMLTVIKSDLNLQAVEGRIQVIALLAPDFGPDRLSDLITNLISLQLVHFTQAVCREEKVKMPGKQTIKYYDVQKKTWKEKVAELPIDNSGRTIILIPVECVVESYNFSAIDFVKKTILTARQEQLKLEGKKASKQDLIKSEIDPLGVDKYKKYALENIKSDPVLLEEYLHRIGLFA
ncbi:hypothetical protein MUDAN_DOGOELCO_02011 [Lactiplantibacillus mudanjiangensis]|uniref:hypothetical protein n=1 Tax=Lactiplantibacillus mudanjiangensis TaxID=1296538 RepID=UPI0010149225|nr:hypothetical protein [Lactiplantibacillus mudanjiangensis]VDG32760.1 hypothetical protein MUDAN_DOGOELCO_02011 [Lactiplantibacillus mudanjiangensis]